LRLEREGLPAAWERFSAPAADCVWLPPVLRPEKIICIGLNYRDHAAESKMEIPKEPVFFNKYNNALVGAAGPPATPLRRRTRPACPESCISRPPPASQSP